MRMEWFNVTNEQLTYLDSLNDMPWWVYVLKQHPKKEGLWVLVYEDSCYPDEMDEVTQLINQLSHNLGEAVVGARKRDYITSDFLEHIVAHALANPSGEIESMGEKRTKPSMHLLPFYLLEETVRVLEFGAKKHAPDNWKKVNNPINTYTDAMLRHAFAYQKGEKVDPDSNLSHISHVICNALFLLWHEENKDGD